jgi:predicted  nucleic acid-binding Zn-ribbon protein
MESLRTRVETLTESQSDLHASHDALKRREADLEQQVRMGQEEKDRLRARIVGLESEVADVRAQWRKEQEGQVKRVENMTRSFDTEKKALGKQYEASLDKLHSTYRVKVHGARARLRAVKEALARCVEEKEMLSDRVVELESRVREMQVAGATLSWGAGDDGSDDGLTGSGTWILDPLPATHKRRRYHLSLSSLTYHLFIHSFVRSFIHLFLDSFIHSFIHSFVRSFVFSLMIRDVPLSIVVGMVAC